MMRLVKATFLLLCFYLGSSFSEQTGVNFLLKEANESYQQAMDSTLLLERKHNFNQALALYLKIEDEFAPICSNELYHAIANCYFYVEEYAWAILYYNRALLLDPTNLVIQNQLAKSEKSLQLPESSNLTVFEKALAFNDGFLINQRLEIFFWLCCGTLAICLLSFYFPVKGMAYLIKALSLFVLLLFISILGTLYLSPIKGILVNPSGLYRHPSLQQQPQLLSMPLLEGTKVTVLDVVEDGYWLKVRLEDHIGFIPSSSIRII